MLPPADKFCEEADFLFQHDFASIYTAKSTSNWFANHGVTVLNWSANLPELNHIENLWGICHKRSPDQLLSI